MRASRFGGRGVGVMVGEAAVHFEEHFGGVGVELLEEAVHHGSAGAVAGVDDHLDAARKVELGGDFVDIGRDTIGGGFAALADGKIARFHHAAEVLYSVAVDGEAPQTVLNPLNSAGLWLPVIITAPSALRWNCE